MAHGVLEHKLAEAGLAGRIQADSAGTGDHFAGQAPDPRARQAAAERGYDLTGMRARSVERADFARFDLILALDREVLADLQALAPGKEDREKVRLLMDFGTRRAAEVPDPYQRPGSAFETALDLIEDAAEGLVAHLRELDGHPSASA